jgi:hypothetical protein
LVAHTIEAALQYWVAGQVCTSVELSPLALHWRRSRPWQKRIPFGHTAATQAAATHTWLDAAQSLFAEDDSPSAEQTRILSDCGSQYVTAGVHTWLLHDATPPAATRQVCVVVHGTGGSNPLPSVLQCTIALFWHVDAPCVHTSATHALFAQYCADGQSAEVTQLTQYIRAVSHSMPSGVHMLSEAHVLRQTLAAHFWPVAQSLSPTHCTHRIPVGSHTCPAGQPSEFVHIVCGTQVSAAQSLLAGQSAAVRQPTQRPVDASQTGCAGSDAQSALLRHDAMLVHTSATQRMPVAQSGSVRHCTQRPACVSHTWSPPQSRLLTHRAPSTCPPPSGGALPTGLSP